MKRIATNTGLGALKSVYPEVEVSNLNIWQYIYPRIKKWGDLPAYVMAETDESLTYKELLDKSLCWAHELKTYFKGSVPPNVSYVMKNNIDCFPLFLGCYAVGAPVCPVRDEVNNETFEIMMTQLMPDIIVMDSSSFETFRCVLDKLKNKPCLYLRGHLQRESGSKDFQEILNSGIKLDESEAGKFESTAVACKVFSSGTTGAPKCIACSHSNFTNCIISFSQKEVTPLLAADEAEQATIIGYLPLAHLFEFEYFTIFAPRLGCRSVYMEYNNNTQRLVSATAKYKPELIRLRYFAIEELSRIENFEAIKSLKTIVFTGCPPNIESFKKINENFQNKLFFQNLYGSSEANIVSTMPVNDLRPGRAGKLLSNCRAKFVDSLTGQNITQTHTIGDLYVKSPFIMNGYMNNPTATKEVLDSDGWYNTGDVGYFDEDNFLEIIDRKNDIITVCAGKEKIKVSPSVIEMIIKLHEGVADVGVIGMPDIKTGEELLKAFVVCNYPVDEDELIKFVAQRAPEEMRLNGGITFVKDLSRNPMGKLSRKYLREKVWLLR